MGSSCLSDVLKMFNARECHCRERLWLLRISCLTDSVRDEMRSMLCVVHDAWYLFVFHCVNALRCARTACNLRRLHAHADTYASSLTLAT
jgi:hypothetical protein